MIDGECSICMEILHRVTNGTVRERNALIITCLLNHMNQIGFLVDVHIADAANVENVLQLFRVQLIDGYDMLSRERPSGEMKVVLVQIVPAIEKKERNKI